MGKKKNTSFFSGAKIFKNSELPENSQRWLLYESLACQRRRENNISTSLKFDREKKVITNICDVRCFQPSHSDLNSKDKAQYSAVSLPCGARSRVNHSLKRSGLLTWISSSSGRSRMSFSLCGRRTGSVNIKPSITRKNLRSCGRPDAPGLRTAGGRPWCPGDPSSRRWWSATWGWCLQGDTRRPITDVELLLSFHRSSFVVLFVCFQQN